MAHDFARVHCPTCSQSALVAFACKARAVCPSCTGRRMTETAAHLCDHVLPEVPVRQWVPSLPHAIRFLMVRDPAVLRLCRGVFMRAVRVRQILEKAGLRILEIDEPKRIQATVRDDEPSDDER